MPDAMPEEVLESMRQALYRGNKIEAIKLYREAVSSGLAEAKNAIDQLEAELRASSPEKFSAPAAKGCGTAAVMFLAAAGIYFLLRA